MKKLFGMIAAVALVAAGIAPAFAADIELSGEVRVRHEVQNMDSGALKDGIGSKGESAPGAADGTFDSAADVDGVAGAVAPTSMWDEDATTGDNATTQRTRINAKVSVDDRTSAFISLADVREWGEDTESGAANQDSNGVHLNEGWLKIDNLLGPVALKAGRQRLSYGAQRLLGALEWTDTGNRWDAFNLQYRSEAADVDFFMAERSTTTAQNTDDSLNGLYATLKMVPGNKVDVYVIQKTGANEMDFNTIGARIAGKAAGADWDVEFATQSGDNDQTKAAKDMGGAAWVAEAGYTLAEVAGGLRIGLQAWAADGESGNDAAFDNLYPTNHFKYGISDVAGTNLSDREGMGVNITAKPVEGLKVKAEWVTVDTEASGKTVGTEMNLGVWYDLTEKSKLYAYGAQFDPDNEWVTGKDDAFQKLGVQIHTKF